MHHRRLTEDAFRAIIEPHLGKLYRMASRLSGNASAAEDLVQELVTRLWDRPGHLADAQSHEAWLVRALCNLHVDLLRREQRQPESGALQLNDEILADRAQIAGRGEQAWSTQQVLRLMTRLPAAQRMVVVLHDMEGYSLEETAKLIGVRTGTVKSRLGRAHKRLREAFHGNASVPSDVLEGEVQSDAVSTI